MKPRRDKGRIDGPFVPMLTNTMASPAWRAMSPYARVLYVALKSRYSFKARNNGRIYLSVRQAAEETGLNKDTIARAFRELAYYGFIVMTKPGCLGVEGRGKAPHWRLTELGYMTDPPRRDFTRWGGVIFHEQKSPKHYLKKKQKPVPLDRTERPAKPDVPLSGSTGHSDVKLSCQTGHTDSSVCPARADISRLTTQHGERRRQEQLRGGVRLQIPDDLSIPGFLLRT